MTILVSVVRFILLVIAGFSYIIFGILLIPFGGLSGRFYRYISPWFGVHMLFLSGGKAEYLGLENLDPKETYLFVGNHQSYVDIFLIFAALKRREMRTLFIVKRELFKIPLFGLMARSMGLVPVEREDASKALSAMQEAFKAVKNGFSLAVFPEGTRTSDGNLQSFKRGAFLIAQQTKVKIAPFVIHGTFEIFPRKGFKIRGGPCKIAFLPSIDTACMKSREIADKTEAVIKEAYEKLRGNI